MKNISINLWKCIVIRLIKSSLSKLNFALGRNPKIERLTDYRKFIPEPFKTVVLISADFELAWAPRYSKEFDDPLKSSLDLARRERANIPLILELCDEYEIPITWATVGHLFLNECNRENGFSHKEIPKVNSYQGPYWNFNSNDWFEYDPCTNFRDSPEWYAPDLIEMILKSKVKHEIGCHTFSHIDCRDEVCPPELFGAEINECKKEAARLGLELKSFVHPGHTIGNLDNLAELGFTSFQSDPGNILGYPIKHKNGLWELKRTYEFVWREGWNIDYHTYRYKTILERAINNNSVCNFWFHPSLDKRFLDKVLPKIFGYLNEKKDGILITTVEGYIGWLNANA